MTCSRTTAIGGALFVWAAVFFAVAQTAANGPVLFADGVISAPGTVGVTFSPDGSTAYFARLGGPQKRWAILQSTFEAGRWTAPVPAVFSTEHHDAGPSLSPDGKRLFFWSLRPNGAEAPKHSRLWVVERRGNGWGEPVELGAPVNGPGRPSANASVSRSGTLYFVTKGEDALGWDDIYFARPGPGDRYTRIENAGPAVNSPNHEFDVYVAPDESLLLFSSNRPGGQGKTDIYVSVRDGNGWKPARPLASPVNSPDAEFAPSLSPDGKHLYFARIGGSNPGLYRVPASEAGLP